MRVWLSVAIGTALLGLATLPAPVLAQQKTVKACQEEWRANKAENQAKGITEKAYVAQCRAGGSAAQPASTPGAKPAPSPSAATSAAQKTVKAYQRYRTVFRAGGQTICHGRHADPNRRGSVSDRTPGKGSLPGGHRRVGEPQFQGLPLRRL